jgi:mannose-6-phosphate isomerase-like protein (cupin superfamily)
MTKGKVYQYDKGNAGYNFNKQKSIKLVMTTSSDAFFVSPNEGKNLRVITDTMTIKISSEKVNGAYSVTEDVTPQGGGAPPHIHRRENEMFYILEGEFEFRCGDRVFNAAKGRSSERDTTCLQEYGKCSRKDSPCSNTRWNGESV